MLYDSIHNSKLKYSKLKFATPYFNELCTHLNCIPYTFFRLYTVFYQSYKSLQYTNIYI